MTLIREERPKPGSFDYLLAEPLSEPVPGRRGWWKAATSETPKARTPPPPPPERDSRRSHITVQFIEVDSRASRRAERRQGQWAVAVLMWAIVGCILLAALAAAHAQPMRYEHWQSTDGSHGEVRRQGSTTDWTAYGPKGQQGSCHQYFVGDTPYTTCTAR